MWYQLFKHYPANSKNTMRIASITLKIVKIGIIPNGTGIEKSQIGIIPALQCRLTHWFFTEISLTSCFPFYWSTLASGPLRSARLYRILCCTLKVIVSRHEWRTIFREFQFLWEIRVGTLLVSRSHMPRITSYYFNLLRLHT